MKRIKSLLLIVGLLCLSTGCDDNQLFEQTAPVDKTEIVKEEDEKNKMQILIQGEQDESILFQLNESAAAKTFYDQLPMSIDVENFGDKEKIFYPPAVLDIHDTPLAKGPSGILAYYEPWGNIAMFYGDCEGANGLYALGEVVSGKALISELNGVIEILPL